RLLGRGHGHGAGLRLDLLDRRLVDRALLDEPDPDPAHGDLAGGTIRDDLELLGTVVGRAMDGGRREEAHVVGLIQEPHDVVDNHEAGSDPALRYSSGTITRKPRRGSTRRPAFFNRHTAAVTARRDAPICSSSSRRVTV